VASLPGVELKHSDAVLLDMMVACDTVVIGLPSHGDDVVAVSITNREFAEALRRRLEAIWRSSRTLAT
jgi:hypothetical protein